MRDVASNRASFRTPAHADWLLSRSSGAASPGAEGAVTQVSATLDRRCGRCGGAAPGRGRRRGCVLHHAVRAALTAAAVWGDLPDGHHLRGRRRRDDWRGGVHHRRRPHLDRARRRGRCLPQQRELLRRQSLRGRRRDQRRCSDRPHQRRAHMDGRRFAARGGDPDLGVVHRPVAMPGGGIDLLGAERRAPPLCSPSTAAPPGRRRRPRPRRASRPCSAR